MTKTMITPLVAVVALALNSVFNISLTGTEQEVIADAIVSLGLLVVTIHGIYKNHKKEGDK